MSACRHFHGTHRHHRSEPVGQTGRAPSIGQWLRPLPDDHLDLHAERVRRKPDEGAVKRDRVVRVPHDRDGDKLDLTGFTTRGVEIDPAGARKIDLRPGVGRAARRAAHRLLGIVERHSEIPGRKPRRESERARCLDHQQSEVAATAVAEPERLQRLLNSLCFPAPIAEAVIDALCKAGEKLESIHRATLR